MMAVDARRRSLTQVFAVAAMTLLGASPLWSATHYVRSGASGDGSGTSWTNAFTQLPQTLQRGDIYYVADGSYPSYTFDDVESGSATITVRKATNQSHGTDEGWSPSFGDGTAVFTAPLIFNRDYYVIDGATRNANRTTPDWWRAGYGFKVVNSTPVREMIQLYDRGTSRRTNHTTLRYVEIEGVGVEAVIGGSEYADRAIYGGGALNLTISRCYIHDAAVPFLIWTTNEMIIEESWISKNTSTALFHSEAIAADQDDNMTIRFNVFEDIEGTGFIVNLRRGSTGNADHWDIYGNVFFYNSNSSTQDGIGGDGIITCINGQNCRYWRIYNNTFINVKYAFGTATGRIRLDGDGGSPLGNELRNNLWVNCSFTGHSGLDSLTHNYYVNTNSGQEDQVQTSTVDPLVDWANHDFRLVGSTIPGMSLAIPYNVDQMGTTRGLDGIWDRGAFECPSCVSAPAAPQNLRLGQE